MSKRVRFTEGGEGNDVPGHKFPKYNDDVENKFVLKNNQELHQGIAPGSRFKEKHSLDSDDEEESKEEYEILKEEDIEGAEEDYEEGEEEEIGITPFNLKEEMEEGDFDVQGHYHFKKENVIRDNWLDNIDWVKIKKKSKQELEESDSSEEANNPIDEVQILKKIVLLMEPGETVTKSLRRLGGKKNEKKRDKRASWRKEKVYDLNAGDEAGNTDEEKVVEEKRKTQLLELTGLVDQMTSAGHYDIYTESYEKFQFKINSFEVSKKAEPVEIEEGTNDDDALDIFASSIDKKDMKEEESNEKTQSPTKDATIKWEFKWKDEEKDPLYGPFTSQQMADWQEQDYFKDGVFVRRTDQQDSVFYSSKRVDFDLYT